ncbi:MAG: hypothetical protein INR73_09865 [Williamsia sp.]|nr:hypothetical protein [Williamsia sp.]
MKAFYLLAVLMLLLTHVPSYAQSWRVVTRPEYAAMQRGFASPPLPYAQTMDFGLGANLVPETIARQLDSVYKQGIRAISIEGNYNSPEPYLSPGYMERVKGVVSELKKRGMHLWIIDEGKYPSGFAGGLISKNAPEYRMQGIVVAARIRLKEGEKIVDHQLPQQVISAVALNEASQENKLIDVGSGRLNWPGAPGNWQIILAEHRFKTSVTRAASNPTHGKDTVNSLIDYLDPEATRKFIEFTHEQYKKWIGDEFGKTVLGFRGDEPEYNFTPWSPRLLEVFKQKKGYDIQPYLASFFLPQPTREQKLAKADFWDVWSDLFRDNFFGVLSDWCARNNLEFMVHINHEDKLMDLARSEGDFFKTMRPVQIPGVDAIWHQIWYDNIADFPKLASSAAHMYGRPRALSESFAAYTPRPTVADARWVVNEEMVRGINLFEWMNWGSAYLRDPLFPALSAYTNRASWLLANGVPAAKLALYCPTETMWLGNSMADSTLRLTGRQLLEHQLDFDYVDRQGISTVFKLEAGGFVNASGQKYTTILFPAVDILTTDVVERLKAFAAHGGKVIFMKGLPSLLVRTSFLQAEKMPPFNWAAQMDADSAGERFWTSLPHDIVVGKTLPALKYLHRKWKAADLYFFFNEGKEQADVDVTLEGTGPVTTWDAGTGGVEKMDGVLQEKKGTKIRLSLPGYGTKFIVVGNK